MRGDVSRYGTAANIRRGAHHRSSLLKPWPLARPMGDVDERAGVTYEVVLCSVMAQVGRDVGIGARRRRQEGIPRSPAHGNGSNWPLRIPGDPHTVMGMRQ